MHKIITPVSAEPISLAEARLHLRIDAIGGTHPDDDLIEAQIVAARELAEHYTRRSLAPKTVEMAIDEFPQGQDSIHLDLPPVASITSVKYDDAAGVEQTLDPSQYVLNTYGSAASIYPVADTLWPTARRTKNAIRIRYVSGVTELSNAVRSGMLLTIGHLYENRMEGTRMRVEQIPMGVRTMLDTAVEWNF